MKISFLYVSFEATKKNIPVVQTVALLCCYFFLHTIQNELKNKSYFENTPETFDYNFTF